MEESPNRPSGGAESQDAFYGELSAELVHLARRAGLRPARAADAAQSVCLKFCKKFPNFTADDANEYHRAWLLQVAHREIVNAFRARRRHPTYSLSALDEESMAQREQSSANAESDERERLLLHHWLEELRQRDPLTHELVYQHGLNGVRIAELAKLTGRDAHWISVRINRVIKKFRAWALKHAEDGAAPS